MDFKICTKCEIKKYLTDFNNSNKTKDGKRCECRECQKEVSKNYRIKNSEKIKKYNDEWNKNNQEYYKKYFENYYTVNYDREKERKLKWNKENKGYFNEYNKKRKKNDTLFYLITMMRQSIYRYLKYKSKKTFDIVGCSPEYLKEHIENQFKEGMSWEKMGKEIHIDHIIPLSSAKSEEELYKLCHYTNLQPLWAEENLKKSNKIVEPISLYIND